MVKPKPKPETKPKVDWRDLGLTALAVFIEALALMFGILVLTVASAALFWFALRGYRKEQGKQLGLKFSLVSALALFVATTVIPVGAKKYFEATEVQAEIYIREAGFGVPEIGARPDRAYVIILCSDASKKYAEANRIAVLMRLEDNTLDRFQDTRIERSSLFTIVNGETQVVMKIPEVYYSRVFDAAKGQVMQMGVDLALAVVPQNTDVNKITSFSRVKEIGGTLIQVKNVRILTH